MDQRSEEYTLPLSFWVREQRSKTICPNCYKLKSGLYPQAVDVFLSERPRQLSCDGVFHAGMGIIREDLLAVLSPHLKDFVLGRCFDESGALISEYRSIYCRNRIRLRAAPNAPNYSTYECNVCGLTAELSDSPYVLRKDLPDSEVFESSIACLFLSGDLAARFPWKQFGDLKPIVIPVLDAPLGSDADEADQSMRALHVPFGAEYLASIGQSRRAKESPANAAELIKKLNPHDAVLVCEIVGSNDRETEHEVPVRTILEAGAEPEELETLRNLLGEMPGTLSWEQLYAKHNGIGLFSPLNETEPAIVLLPVNCWLEEKGKMFGWFFEGVEAAFEGLPYGSDDVIPIAALCYSPDRWFLVTSGPNAGMVHFWGHEDSPMEETPFAESLEAFISRLTGENAPDYFGGLIRFKAAQARDPKPEWGTELRAVRYVVKQK